MGAREIGAGIGIGSGLVGSFVAFREQFLPGEIIAPFVVLASLAILFMTPKKRTGYNPEKAIDDLL